VVVLLPTNKMNEQTKHYIYFDILERFGSSCSYLIPFYWVSIITYFTHSIILLLFLFVNGILKVSQYGV